MSRQTPGFHGDIEVEIVTETLQDHFLISPNDLHRGWEKWNGLTLHGRGMLSALLTFRSGWKITRSGIEAIAPELGRKKISAILKELESRGHLSREKINGRGGKFTWRWTVRMFPAQTTCPSGGDGSDQGKHGVSAGRTISPSGADGGPTVGPSGDDGYDQGKHSVSAGQTISPSGHLEVRSTYEEKTPPPSPSVSPGVDQCDLAGGKEEELPSAGEKPGNGTVVGQPVGPIPATVAPSEIAPSADALALVRQLPAIRGDRPSAQLAVRVTELLGVGWTVEGLRKELVRDLGSARGTGVYHARLAGLVGLPVPSVAPVVVPAAAPARPVRVARPEPVSHEVRGVRRCEHGRVAVNCPLCRDAVLGVAPRASAGVPVAGSQSPSGAVSGPGASGGMDPRLAGLLGAFVGREI